MHQQKSLKLNFIMNTILTMSTLVFPLITFPYVSRILLPEGTGRVSFATSLISYFNMIAQLGIPTYGIRACAKVRDDRKALTKTAQELLLINVFMSVLSYLCLAAALIFIPSLREDRALYIVISFTIMLTAIGMEWLYKALEQYTYITVRSIIFKLIALIAMFVLIHDQGDYTIYGGISIFAASASSVLNFINSRKYISLKPVGNYHFRRHIKAIVIFFAMSCATTIYLNLDSVMLGFMKTKTDVGYYDAAVKIKNILVSFVTSLGTVLLPRVSYYVEQGLMAEFQRICKKALNFVFIIALPLTMYFIFFAHQGIYFLFGSAYEESVLPMQIIMPTLVFIGFSNVLGIQILVPLGKEKIVLYSEIVGAIVDLILNAILIPKIAATGAAIGTLVAEMIVLIVQYCALRQKIGRMLQGIACWKIIFALVLGTVMSVWCIWLPLSSFTMLVISACLFFGIYGVFLRVLKEPLFTEITDQLFEKIQVVLKK